MSYCRFQNTLRDLMDCRDAMLDDLSDNEAEADARRRLISLCKRIADNYGDGDEN